MVPPLHALKWWQKRMQMWMVILHDLILCFQSYVDDQLISTNMIKNAVIAGHDGNIWASSAGFNVSSSRAEICRKILGRAQSIAWKRFKF